METIASTTNLNIRIDSNLKKESDSLFKSLGLNMTTAINIFLTQCVKSKSIPFEDLIKALKESDKIINDPTRKKYHDINELVKALLDD